MRMAIKMAELDNCPSVGQSNIAAKNEYYFRNNTKNIQILNCELIFFTHPKTTSHFSILLYKQFYKEILSSFKKITKPTKPWLCRTRRVEKLKDEKSKRSKLLCNNKFHSSARITHCIVTCVFLKQCTSTTISFSCAFPCFFVALCEHHGQIKYESFYLCIYTITSLETRLINNQAYFM